MPTHRNRMPDNLHYAHAPLPLFAQPVAVAARGPHQVSATRPGAAPNRGSDPYVDFYYAPDMLQFGCPENKDISLSIQRRKPLCP